MGLGVYSIQSPSWFKLISADIAAGESMPLTHYTDELGKFISILEHGFYYFPNERSIFRHLIGIEMDEPQCRGMVSFCDHPIDVSLRHRSNYGHYGVTVKKQWALSQGAAKVLYVGHETPVFDAFASLFHSLMPKVEPSGNEHLDKWMVELGATQPEFAKSLGNPIYPHLLKLHEFMQSDEQVAESEWRVVSSLKGSWNREITIEDLKIEMLKMYRAGLFPTLRLQPGDVQCFVCPHPEIKIMYSLLPTGWDHIEIVGVDK